MLVDNNLVRDHCPLCASLDIRKIGDIEYFKPLIFSTKEISLVRTPELWKCRECKSGFTQYAIPEQESARLYGAGVGAERWTSKPFQEEKTKRVIRVLEKVFFPGSNVLDVGCNTGELLDFAKSFGCTTSGVEISTESREIVKEKGHNCCASIDEVQGEFDVITAFDLVEHLYDFRRFMALCNKKLRENGLLIILTGNISSLSSNITGSKWWYVRFPEHIIFPSRKCFYSIPDFSVNRWFRTYAATKYYSSFWSKTFSLLKGIQYSDYMAQPSFVYDHVLVVLTK
jgi:SAM-dependent methyltransferase